jgi:C4-type Zn-finger protein
MDVCTVCLTPQETHPIGNSTFLLIFSLDCPHAQLLCTTCYTCGHRSKVVRPDNQVADRGRRITLAVTSKEDLNRQLVKVCR